MCSIETRASPGFASVSGRFETCPYAFVCASRRGLGSAQFTLTPGSSPGQVLALTHERERGYSLPTASEWAIQSAEIPAFAGMTVVVQRSPGLGEKACFVDSGFPRPRE